ncbi:MAG: ATP phosphoribosyltransferase regulatory subunit, partial [Alphaproteobacteria bacterium]|nr:ATP phosphoribosyltransferase regulatory subunit [Alphaproteobacteria bacterium]
YKQNKSLVRGLDYYAHTVFEFTTNELGAQGTVLAGGRYDKLIKQMGGDDIPAVGFAAGIERLMELSKKCISKDKPVSIFVLDEECANKGLKLALDIRNKGIRAELDVVKNMNKSMKKALNSDAKFIIFIGKEESNKNMYKIKDLDSRKEEMFNLDQLLNKITSYEF